MTLVYRYLSLLNYTFIRRGLPAILALMRFSYSNSIDESLMRQSLPPITMSLHSIRNLDEPSDVRTSQQARRNVPARLAIVRPLGSGVEADLVARLHDALELGVHLFGRPLETLAVLGHLETGDCDSADVGCL